MFAGIIDEASIYNRALTTSEIAAIYLAGGGGKCPPNPPAIMSQPTNQTVALGSTATFNVSASGTPPLSYQWSLDGTNLLKATNATLTLPNVQLSQAGDYAVTVANAYGSAVSSNSVLTVLATVPCDPAALGLVGWWRAEGNASDSIGADNGVIQGAVSYGAGEVGEGFVLNGTNADIKVAASATLDVGRGNGLTIEAWINPTGVALEQPIVEWNSGSGYATHFWISTPAGGGAGCVYANLVEANGTAHPFGSGGGYVVANAFQHVALTYDKVSGLATLYLNGTNLMQQTVGVFNPDTSEDMYIGTRISGGAQADWWTGVIDEVSLYNRALTAAEVQAIYAAGSAGKCYTPVPPILTTQPANQTNFVGQTASFSVTASGTAPLCYQWRFNATNLVGATNAVLTLPNVQLSQAGNYSVLVTNAYGATDSMTAALTVDSPSACEPEPAGLVGWWRAEGNATDSVGADNGVVQGGVGYAAGEVAQGFLLNGLDADIKVPASTTLDVGRGNGLTIEAWINPTTVALERPIVEWNSGSGYAAHFWISTPAGGGAGCLYANLVDTNGAEHPFGTGGGYVVANLFQHVALTYDKVSGLAALYLNGTNLMQQTVGAINPLTSEDMYIGTRISGGAEANWWTGIIDEVSLYDRALSSNEIAGIYNAGSAGKCLTIATQPSIQGQPTNATVNVGSAASFSVSASGTPPLSYQWNCNGTNLIGATNATLVWTNVQANQSGSYSVLVTNLYGSTNSALAVLTVNFPMLCDPPPAGLVAWWAAEGDAYDSVGTNQGVLHGGAGYATGEVGQAFSLDGTSGYFSVPASPSLNVGAGGGLTIEGWINSPTITAQQILVEWHRTGTASFGVHMQTGTGSGGSASAGALYANLVDTSGAYHFIWSAPGLLASNQFQHVALTYNKSSGVGTLYVDGAVVAQSNLGVFTPQTRYDFYLGERPGWFLNFAGLLDEMSVYNRALASNEIAAIYQAGSDGKCPLNSPPPRTATGIATLTGGMVTGVTLTDGGSGYTNTPLIHLVGGGGSGATAVAVISNGTLIGITVTSSGSGYTNAPVVVIDPPIIANPVLGVAPVSFLVFSNLTIGGTYQLQQSVFWYWTNQFASIEVTNSLYTQSVAGLQGNYRLALSPVPAQAFATAQLVNDFVVGATVTSGGSGYVSSPAITIVGGGGTGALAAASVSGGVVTHITFTNAGFGYTNPPRLEIAAPPAVAAVPTVFPGLRIDSSNLAPYVNYQLQFQPELGGTWSNWNGGTFIPTAATNTLFLWITNGAGFFRVQSAP